MFTNGVFTYLHMEFVPHGDMVQWIEKIQPDPFRLRQVFARLAAALAYLHQRGVIHRDLKLQNGKCVCRCASLLFFPITKLSLIPFTPPRSWFIRGAQY
jgi:serine/threonine protein kinase